MAPKKSWGQNFLRDAVTLESIAAAACQGVGTVLELGAGMGALTHALLERGARVVAVERDRDLVPQLRERFAGVGECFRLVEGDAAQTDYGRYATELGPYAVAGNLPYQLSSRILVDLADTPVMQHAVVMVQKEVALRLCAAPDSRTYGLLSVLVQRAWDATILRIVPPGCFVPAPKVHSAVVKLSIPTKRYAPDEDRSLVAAARAAFSGRRKMLRRSVSSALQAPLAKVEEVLAAGGIDGERRAETLSVEEFAVMGGLLARAGLLAERA